MTDIDTALAASNDAVEQLIVAGQQTGPAWTASRAPGNKGRQSVEGSNACK